MRAKCARRRWSWKTSRPVILPSTSRGCSSSRSVTGHSVTVKDGVLYSGLPFFGQAWRVPYGGGHALNFQAPIRNYSLASHPKGGYVVTLYVKTDEDEHVYQFRIFENGSTSLDVQSGNRDRISFSGEMLFAAE